MKACRWSFWPAPNVLVWTWMTRRFSCRPRNARSERIVAKLRRKVPKFALMVVREEHRGADVASDVIAETYDVLRSLGHSESEARRLLDMALASKKKFKDVQSLVEAIYQQNRNG